MGKNALIIAVAVMASRVLGIVREILLARAAGVHVEKNALDLAFLVPDILNHIISTGFLSVTFIPVFTGYLVRDQQDRAWKFFSVVATTLGVVMLVVIAPSWIWMRELLVLFTSVTPSEQVLNLAVEYGRIILPAQLFFLGGAFLVSVQHVKRRFLLPSLTGVIYNLAIVAGGLFYTGQGLAGFAWGVPVGAFVGFILLQLFGAWRSGVRFSPQFSLTDKDFLHFMALTIPLVLGMGAMFALEFVTRSFGAAFGDSGISALNYAYRMMYTLVAVFGFSVGVAGYPRLAQMAKEQRSEELNRNLFGTLQRMLAILIPVLLAVFFTAHVLIRVLLERGAFDAAATARVSELMRWYLPASIALCAQVIVVRSFYAWEQMWIPTLINTGLFIASLPVYHLLKPILDIVSVPVVGSVTAWLQVSILLVYWCKTHGTDGLTELRNDLLRIGLAVIPGILVLWGMNQVFPTPFSDTLTGNLVWLGLTGGMILIFQFLFQWISGSTATRENIDRIRRRLPV